VSGAKVVYSATPFVGDLKFEKDSTYTDADGSFSIYVEPDNDVEIRLSYANERMESEEELPSFNDVYMANKLFYYYQDVAYEVDTCTIRRCFSGIDCRLDNNKLDKKDIQFLASRAMGLSSNANDCFGGIVYSISRARKPPSKVMALKLNSASFLDFRIDVKGDYDDSIIKPLKIEEAKLEFELSKSDKEITWNIYSEEKLIDVDAMKLSFLIPQDYLTYDEDKKAMWATDGSLSINKDLIRFQDGILTLGGIKFSNHERTIFSNDSKDKNLLFSLNFPYDGVAKPTRLELNLETDNELFKKTSNTERASKLRITDIDYIPGVGSFNEDKFLSAAYVIKGHQLSLETIIKKGSKVSIDIFHFDNLVYHKGEIIITNGNKDFILIDLPKDLIPGFYTANISVAKNNEYKVLSPSKLFSVVGL